MDLVKKNNLTVKQKIFNGTIWVVLGFGGSQVLRLASILILAKMLSPSDYGLVAIVNVILSGLYMSTDFGFRENVLQNKLGENTNFLNSIWTLQVIKGLFVWVVCIFLAWPVSVFYEQQILLPVIIVSTFSAVLTGLNSAAVCLTDKHIDLKKQTLYQFVAQAFSLITMITIAYIYPTVWALVAGAIVSAGVFAYLSHNLLPLKAKFRWDTDTNRSILSFGKWVAISSAMGFLYIQSSPLILGKFLTLEQLGLYSLGITVARIFQDLHARLLHKIVTPTVAHLNLHDNKEARVKLVRLKSVLISIFLPAFIVLITFSNELISLVFDERYSDAAWIMQLYCITYIPVIISGLGNFYMAFGDTKLLAKLTFIKTVSFFLFITAGYFYNKANGIILAVCLYNSWLYFVDLYSQIKYKLWFQYVDIVAFMLAVISLLIAFHLNGGGEDLLSHILPKP